MEQDPLERVHAPEEVRVTAPAEMAKADSEAAAESDAEVLVEGTDLMLIIPARAGDHGCQTSSMRCNPQFRI
jgi:hypothetical protein